jgi:hypothetical protein
MPGCWPRLVVILVDPNQIASFATRLLPVDEFYDCDSPFVQPHGKKKMYYWRSSCVFVGQAIHRVWARHQEA